MEAVLGRVVRLKMADITENSKLILRAGTVVVVVISLLYMGRWWESIEGAKADIARHEADIRELRQTFAQMHDTLMQIQADQSATKDNIATAARNTTYLVTDNAAIKVALAERGIVVKGN